MLPTVSRFRVRCLVAVFVSALAAEVLSAGPEGGAEEPADKETDGPAEPTSFGRELSDIVRRGRALISLRPHFGDLVSKDHFGITARARYGFAEDWEALARVNAYVAHGLGDVPAFSKVGVSSVQVGLRRQVIRQPEHEVGLVAGIDYSRPVGRPPQEMADANSHVTPHVVVSRRLASRPEWTV